MIDQRFAKIVLNQCQSVPVQFGQILSVSPRYVLGSNSQAGEFASEWLSSRQTLNTARGDIRRVEVESWLDIWLDNGPSPPVLLIKRVIKASAYMLAVLWFKVWSFKTLATWFSWWPNSKVFEKLSQICPLITLSIEWIIKLLLWL